MSRTVVEMPTKPPRLLTQEACPCCGLRWISLTKDQRRTHIAFCLWPGAQERRRRERKRGRA